MSLQLHHNLPRSLYQHWLLVLPLVLFFALALPYLDRPGLHYDEALESAAPAVHLLRGMPTNAVNGGAIWFGNTELPLMVQNHIGAIQVYAALPFIAFLGPTALALRLMTVLVGGVTIVAVYAFTAQVYGRAAALAAALWLATFPSFVFWSRQGVFVTNLAPCFAACAFALAARWWRTRLVWQIGLAGLFAGLAIYSKLSALWLVVGIAGWGAIVWAASRAGTRKQAAGGKNAHGATTTTLPTLREGVVAGVGVLLGILPIIAYNIVTGFKTFEVVGKSASTTYLGTSNLNVVSNLGTRLLQFVDVLRSGEHLWYLGGPFPNNLALVSLLVALGVIVVDLVAGRGQGWQRSLLVPFLIVACIAQSCFTISALWFTHFAIAVWLPAVIVGVAIGRVVEQRPSTGRQAPMVDELKQHSYADRLAFRSLHFWHWVPGLLVVMVAGSQAMTSMAYLRALQATGGLSFHSTAIYDVSRFLETRTEHIVALDWGIAAPVEYLTNGAKAVEEYFGYEQAPPQDFAANLQKRFGQHELYVTHAQYQEAFVRRQAFLDAVAAAGLRAETVNVSIRADGWPMLEVWRVLP